MGVQKRFQNGYGVVVWTVENDTVKTISVDANLFENRLVWTGLKQTNAVMSL